MELSFRELWNMRTPDVLLLIRKNVSDGLEPTDHFSTGDTHICDVTVRQGESKSWHCHPLSRCAGNGKTTVYCYLHLEHKEFFDE